MQNNIYLTAEPISEINSLHTSRRTSSLHRRTSNIGKRTPLHVPGKERVYIAIAMTLQAINIVLLIAAALTDIFQVDGTRAIQNGVDLAAVSTALGVSATERPRPFCYSLWGAHKCGTAEFHSQAWYTARGVELMGFPSPGTYTLMKGASAFTVLAVCYSFINIIATGVVVCLQNYTAVLCAWSVSTWITILISWTISVGVYSRGVETMNSTTIVGRKVHIKDYCSFSTSFALAMTAFALHALQFTFTVIYTRMFESRTKSLVTEQKHLNEEP